MLDIWNPTLGIYRVSILSTGPKVTEGCFHPDIGYFRCDSPEHAAISKPWEVDSGTKVGATDFTCYLIAVWPTDNMQVVREHIHEVRTYVWVVNHFVAEALERQAKDYPLHAHDVTVDVCQHGPWPIHRVKPCKQHIAAAVRAKPDVKRVGQAIVSYLNSSMSEWSRHTAYDYLPEYSLNHLEGLLGLNKAIQADRDEKWEKERAERETPDTDLLIDNLLDDACPHNNVVANKTHDDGSIDGKCQDCGEEGFPITDKGYEEFMDGEEGGALRRIQQLLSDLKTEPTYAVLVRQALAEASR